MDLPVADFRSDTVTRPTPAMRARMGRAEVGDDVYGEDPTVNALEARAAALTDKAAAVFVTSGTQGNLIAQLAHCDRGDEVITGEGYHVHAYEAGGAAVLGGLHTQTLPLDPSGLPTVSSLGAAVKADDPHFPRSRLLVLENTFRGRAFPPAVLAPLCAEARSAGLRTHLDGARLFNAAIATASSPAALAEPFDSVTFCLSKGLGAPAGSVLCGDAAFVRRARRLRKMLGGGLRQAGFLAAAGLYALEHHVQRLAEDHARAGRLAEGLRARFPEFRDRIRHDTSMVHAALPPDLLAAWHAHLGRRGVRFQPRGRWVAHLDVDDGAVDRALAVTDAFLAGPGSAVGTAR